LRLLLLIFREFGLLISKHLLLRERPLGSSETKRRDQEKGNETWRGGTVGVGEISQWCKKLDNHDKSFSEM